MQVATDAKAAYFAQSSEEEQPSEPIPAKPPTGPPEQLPPPVGQGTTLAELEQLAKEQHPRLSSASEAIRAAEGRAWQAGRPPNPQIGASSPQWAGPQSQYNTFLSQDIPTGGKLRLSSAAAQVEVEQSQLAQVRALFEVLTAVRKQFYATLALQSRVEALRELQTITAKSCAAQQRSAQSGRRGPARCADSRSRGGQGGIRPAKCRD